MSRSRTQFAILALLRIQPMSGYEIREFCRTRLPHFWSESFGQIYPTLARLAAEGLVRTSERADNPRATYYELTTAGGDALGAWLSDAPAPRLVRDELLLKLFCGGAAAPGMLREHVSAARRHALAELEALREASTELDALASTHPDNDYWRLMLRSGELAFEARLRWCAEAERLLAARTPTQGETDDTERAR
jgi:PadR family transcriptional regulator AphA